MAITYHAGRRIQALEEDRIGATASQGNNGGAGLGGDQTNTGGGGGGGAGAAGVNAANSAGGNGGIGLQSDIWQGTNAYYAGGGGGGTWANISGDPNGGTGGTGGGGNGGEHYDNPSTQTAGSPNSGGGGGAAGITDGTVKAGGSGVVILQFTTSGTTFSTTGSPTSDTTVSGKTTLKYTGSGTFVLSSGSPDVRYLVVGGGGGGAGGAGGGGGAGGFLTGTKSSLASGTYTVTIGAGGAGRTSGLHGSNGANSSFAGVVASGGGGGAENNSSAPAGADGGSGGGGGGRHGGAGGSTVDGTTVSAIDTNLQVGSRFEETNTRNMYNFTDPLVVDDDFTSYADQTAFDNSWITSNTAKFRGNPTNDNIDILNSNAYDNIYYDLGSVSDTKWLCKFKVTLTTAGSQSLGFCYFYVGSTTGDANESNDGLGFYFYDNANNTTALADNGNRPDQTTVTANLGISPSTTTYYAEMKRTSAEEFVVKLYDNDSYSSGQLGSTATLSISSGITGLQYFKIMGYNTTGGLVGTLDDFEFYNNSTTTSKYWQEIGT